MYSLTFICWPSFKLRLEVARNYGGGSSTSCDSVFEQGLLLTIYSLKSFRWLSWLNKGVFAIFLFPNALFLNMCFGSNKDLFLRFIIYMIFPNKTLFSQSTSFYLTCSGLFFVTLYPNSNDLELIFDLVTNFWGFFISI